MSAQTFSHFREAQIQRFAHRRRHGGRHRELADVAFQEIFQLSPSGSYEELYQLGRCTPKTGCSMVMQASDGNLWIADPPAEAVYSITTGGRCCKRFLSPQSVILRA